jgi:hypothetical protein
MLILKAVSLGLASVGLFGVLSMFVGDRTDAVSPAACSMELVRRAW